MASARLFSGGCARRSSRQGTRIAGACQCLSCLLILRLQPTIVFVVERWLILIVVVVIECCCRWWLFVVSDCCVVLCWCCYDASWCVLRVLSRVAGWGSLRVVACGLHGIYDLCVVSGFGVCDFADA